MHIYLYTCTRCFDLESRNVFRRRFRNLDDTEWKKKCRALYRSLSARFHGRVGKTTTEAILLIRQHRASPVNRRRYKWHRENTDTAKTKVDHAAYPTKKISVANMETRHRRGPRRSTFTVKYTPPYEIVNVTNEWNGTSKRSTRSRNRGSRGIRLIQIN